MLELLRPCEKYLASYGEARAECEACRPNEPCGFADPAMVLEKANNYEQGISLKPGQVRSTTFWLVEGDRFIGEIRIRHELTEALYRRGGHIGYEVRPSACRQGYGTKMLAMVLPYCRDVLGLDRVLLTCDDDNVGSYRIMERNGGILEDKVINETERGIVLSRRYWITLRETE